MKIEISLPSYVRGEADHITLDGIPRAGELVQVGIGDFTVIDVAWTNMGHPILTLDYPPGEVAWQRLQASS